MPALSVRRSAPACGARYEEIAMSATYQGITDQYGRPIVKPLLLTEVAGPTVTGVRSPMTGYPGDGLNPVRLAHILREADEGDPMRYLELAETVEERDLHAVGVLGTRKRSISQLDITIEAASEDPQHVAQAEMIRSWLDRDELADELFDMLDAVGKGISFTEIIWDTSEGQWDVNRLDWRDPRWFRFRREDGRTPLLRTDDGDQTLPGGKFIVTAIKAKSGLPIRSGLARIIAWAWMFKAFTQRDWAIFTQTYGQPVRLGKYGPNASPEEKATLFRAVANIAGDCAAIIPESMAIDFVESKSVSASTDLYLKRSDWLDQQVSKAVLGQTATTDAIAGGHAVGQEHRQVQKDIETADAKALSAILNRDLVRVWIDLEYGPQKKYPRLKVGDEDEIELNQLVAAVDKLEPMGLKIPVKWMRDRLRAPEPQPGEPVLERAAPPTTGSLPPITGRSPKTVPAKPAGSAAPDKSPALHAVRDAGGDEIDALTRYAEKRAAGAMEALIDRIRDLVEQADTLEDVRSGLLRLVPDMPETDLATAMRQALAFAELTGRSDIDDRR
jgi:phage gp29-like protein